MPCKILALISKARYYALTLTCYDKAILNRISVHFKCYTMLYSEK